jgi:hypothetical protein
MAVSERHQLHMLLHGGDVLFIGLLAGIVFDAAVAGRWGEEAERAWRVAHAGTTGVGVMLSPSVR